MTDQGVNLSVDFSQRIVSIMKDDEKIQNQIRYLKPENDLVAQQINNTFERRQITFDISGTQDSAFVIRDSGLEINFVYTHVFRPKQDKVKIAVPLTSNITKSTVDVGSSFNQTSINDGINNTIKTQVDAGVNAIFQEYQCCCCAWLINGCWFQQDYYLDGSTPTQAIPYGQPYMVSTGPLNVGSIFDEDTPEINGLGNNNSLEKFLQAIYYQSKVCNESSKANMQTWFVSDNPYNPITGEGEFSIFCNGIPRSKTNAIFSSATWKAGEPVASADLHDSFSLGATADYTTNYAVSTRVQWFLPLQLVSQIFMVEDDELWYNNSFSQLSQKIILTARNAPLAKLIGGLYPGKSNYLNKFQGVGAVDTLSSFVVGTGGFYSPMIKSTQYATYMDQARLKLVVKASAQFSQKIKSRQSIARKIQVYNQRTTKDITSTAAVPDMKNVNAMKGVQDVMLSLHIKDEASNDSCWLHGIPTSVCAYDIVKAVNNKIINDYSVPYFYRLQMNVTNDQVSYDLIKGVNQNGIINIKDYMEITKQSMRVNQNIQYTGNPMLQYKNLYKLFQQYCIVNLESYRGATLSDNVAADGANLGVGQLTISWDGINTYIPHSDNPQQSTMNSLNGDVHFGQRKAGNDNTDTYTQANIQARLTMFGEAFIKFLPQSNQLQLVDEAMAGYAPYM